MDKTRHFHFRTILNTATSVPNSENNDYDMRLFIPLNVDHSSANVKYDLILNGGILLLKLNIDCNKRGLFSDIFMSKNIVFCCVKLKNVYRNSEIKMIISKIDVNNDGRIETGNRGKYTLHEYPKWDNNDDNTVIIPESDIKSLDDYSFESGIDKNILQQHFSNLEAEDSCTIPPNNQ